MQDKNTCQSYDYVKAAYHIVKSLGFKITTFNGMHEIEPKDFLTRCYIGLATIDGKHTVDCISEPNRARDFFEVFSNPNTFLEVLFTKTTGFYISSDRKTIPNPFFGCKSIEEALVISDLHFQNG